MRSDKTVGSASTKRKTNGRRTGKNKKSAGSAKRDRADDDRQPANVQRTITDEQRLDEFRKSFFQSVLPDLPTIPGYHVCWLTTTNPRDSIAGRIRLGYEPVRQSDVPGWDNISLKTGEYAGCIGVNEMIAFKLPLPLYETYMREAHHTQPLYEEEKLTSVIDTIQDEAARQAKSGRRGVKLEIEEGIAELGQDRDPGSFSDGLRGDI